MSVAVQRRADVDWINRREDVEAHLYFATAEVGEVHVQLDAATLTGVLLFPAPGERRFGIKLDLAPVSPPASGTVMEISYRHGLATYTWLTALHRAEDAGHWVVELPAVIVRDERRIASRHPVVGDLGFGMRVEDGWDLPTRVPLSDLSVAGLAFALPSSGGPVRIGKRMLVTVELPDGRGLPMEIEIRNLRPAGAGQQGQVAGARFLNPHPDQVRALAQALSAQRAA